MGNWYYSPDHAQHCQVIEAQTLWGETICLVWLTDQVKVIEKVLNELTKLLIWYE